MFEIEVLARLNRCIHIYLPIAVSDQKICYRKACSWVEADDGIAVNRDMSERQCAFLQCLRQYHSGAIELSSRISRILIQIPIGIENFDIVREDAGDFMLSHDPPTDPSCFPVT